MYIHRPLFWLRKHLDIVNKAIKLSYVLKKVEIYMDKPLQSRLFQLPCSPVERNAILFYKNFKKPLLAINVLPLLYYFPYYVSALTNKASDVVIILHARLPAFFY